MPLYEYKCDECGKVEEKIFKLDERPDIIECDYCNHFMSLIMSPGHFVIHGYNEANGYSKEK